MTEKNPVNPYSAPRSTENSYSREPQPEGKSPVIGLVILILGTVMGGIVGNVTGNGAAHALGYMNRPFRNSDLFEIAHPLGLVFLVLGALIASWLGSHFGRRQ